MKFICFNSINDIPTSSLNLFKLSSKKSVFLSKAWFQALENSKLFSDPFIYACVESNNTIVTILPVLQVSKHHWKSFTHNYSSYYSVLINLDNNSDAFLTCLVNGIFNQQIHHLTLSPFEENDFEMAAFKRIISRHGYQTITKFKFFNWIYRNNKPNFAKYLSSRPSRTKNTIKRKTIKLNKEYGFSFSIYSESNIQLALKHFHQVYKNSWKAYEQYFDLIDSIVNHLSKSKQLRIGILYVKQQPIASQIWFYSDQISNIFKLSYDENWKQYSPGTILLSNMLEHAFTVDKSIKIDFLTGNDTYKREWMNEKRTFVSTSFFIEPQNASNPSKILSFIKNLFR